MAKRKVNWVTQAAFAQHVGVGRRVVAEYLDRDIVKRDRRGIDLDAGRLALFAHLRSVAAGRTSEPGELDLTAERARLAHAQANAQEAKNAEQSGELIPADQVETFTVSLLSGVRTNLLGVPTKAAALVHAASTVAECQDILYTLQCESLQEISDALAGNRLTAPSKRSQP